MNKLISLAQRAPKATVALFAMLIAAIIIPAALSAWGPSRDTYTIDEPAKDVVFNSITDNPNYGDERNFVTIKPVENKNDEKWTDELKVTNGAEYYVRMYVHNNAAANLNLVAHDVTAKFNIPDYNAKRIQIDGYLSASNAQPEQVWDQAVFTSDNLFNISYVSGSAKYTNNANTSGFTLSNKIATTGTELGYESLDGDIPGCMQYTGIVTFKVKATSVAPTLEKTVRISGATDKTFKETVAVNPGDKVDYQIHFKNTTGETASNVVIKDVLPAGITYVSGTSYLLNSAGTKQIADGVTAGGAIIGSYDEDGDAYIKFTAVVAANNALATCGTNTLVNTASATTEIATATDTATVTVTKTGCTPTTTVTTPSELSHTGPADTILSILGLGTLVTTAGYYVASRRSTIGR